MNLPPPIPPFSPIREIFPDVYQVESGFQVAPFVRCTRNMTIVRRGRELTLINSVRLCPEREAELDQLGEVKHLLRTGDFHGVDDRYMIERYRPTFWAPPGIKGVGPTGYPTPDRELLPGSCPIEDGLVFRFEKGKAVEVAILLERSGGILITCDCYQHWTTFDGCSAIGKVVLFAMGFGPEHIGGPWTKAMGPHVRADFDRLLELPFSHLLPAHGEPIRDRAKAGLRNAIRKRFGSSH